MKFENTTVFNFTNALKGMRNPLESWAKNDTVEYPNFIKIGENDLKLAQKLIKAGPEHRKFLRQIFVSVDISAPIYWWKEFDTYKVGTVANSTSTMHTLSTTNITKGCFEISDDVIEFKDGTNSNDLENIIINYLEELRLLYLESKDKSQWKKLIQLLPSSWIQLRTVTMSYENLFSMCSKSQRRFHKLTEWSVDFINWARSLPYSQELIFIDEVE